MIVTWLIEPCRFAFFLRALVVATAVGAACGVIGVFVTMRRMSYVGHGLAHAAFGGAVVAYLTHRNFYLGVGGWVVAAMLVITLVMRQRRIPADAAIGIVTTASFALGVAMLSRVEPVTRNLEAVLFGQVLGVTPRDVAVTVCGVLVILSLVASQYKALVATTFDRDAAAVLGIRTTRAELLYALLLAAVVILGMRVIGVTMLAAALVIPAMTARLLTDQFRTLIVCAPIAGALGAVLGLYVSYYLDVAAGAAIVLTNTAGFAVAWGWHLVRQARRPALSDMPTGPWHEHTHQHETTAHLHPHPGDRQAGHHVH